MSIKDTSPRQKGDAREGGGWATPRDLHRELDSLWEKGVLQGYLLSATVFSGFGIELKNRQFPLFLKAKLPSRKDAADKFPEVCRWENQFVKELIGSGPFRVEWITFDIKNKGKNQVPKRVFIDSSGDLLCLLGRGKGERFDTLRRNIKTLLSRFPRLRDSRWITREKSFVELIELEQEFPQVMSVLEWYDKDNRKESEIRVREADIPGVDTKFIERRVKYLSPLLDALFPLPGGSARGEKENAPLGQPDGERGGFFARRGLKAGEDSSFVRFKVSGYGEVNLPGGRITDPDLLLPEGDFARLNPAVPLVFIVENKTTYLSFPALSLPCAVIFGEGKGGGKALRSASWLQEKQVFYWGDIDTHGLHILSVFRSYIPGVCSLLMDKKTMADHEEFWVPEEDAKTYKGKAKYLVREERELLGMLRQGEFQKGGQRMRLEQERIGWDYARAEIERRIGGRG